MNPIHHRHHDHLPHGTMKSNHGNHRDPESPNRTAAVATLHCLLGCAIGEVAGLIIGTALGWGNLQTIGLAVALAFLSGFALTSIPFLRRGFGLAASLKIALAADTASITVMEIVDNVVMMVVPGAMDAPIDTALFWGSMMFSLAVAGILAFPLNRWLISRGKGHALAHRHHH
jgi:hypothetical protein